MADNFREKVQQLQAELEKAKAALSSETCTPLTTIIAVVTPVVIFLALFFVTPSFVTVDDEGKPVRNIKKVFMWTVGLTLVVWAGLYGYTRYTSGGQTQACVK